MFRRKGPSEVEIARENEVKIGITNELSAALKLVQKENIGTEDQAVYSTDTANNVCNCIEAIFLHGLKSKAVTKIASYVGLGPEATAQSNLNFWNFVSRFTHGEVIAQLKHLGQITTEIGLCRAWVRVALNDGLMESYIDAMVSDTKNLEYFYHRTAYLRDREQPGIMQTYLQGLMNFQFKLSYNASVLNEWSYAPLMLAGIIDTKDAPPPIIKPPGQKPKSSKSSHKESDSETIVTVRQERSRSHGNSHKVDSRDSSYNPMEQPKFGQPPDSSYYVTSSEFTSKDVEEFKKISRNVQRPLSECSSSSHVSAPDPPHMNISPSAYVQKYGAQIGSPCSAGTHENKKDKSVKERQAEIENIEGSGAVSKTDSQHMDSVCRNIQMEEPVSDTVLSSCKVDTDEFGTTQKDDLEASWEEFYKSPVKKFQDENMAYRKVQRLESINRDAKEEAILSSILDPDSFEEADRLKAEPEQIDDEIENRIESIADNIVMSDNTNLATITNETVISDVCIDTDTNKDLLVYNSNETHTTEISELLDESQKLLNELGIEEQCDMEGFKSENFEEEDIVHESTKASKSKKKSASDRLKPQLSLSPPKSDIVKPELSNAVADKVDQIRTLENPEYLSKHRLSLQYAGNVRKSDKHGHRKSLPDVLEHKGEDDRETYSIEDHLYDGVPLDDTREPMSRSHMDDSNENIADEEKGEIHDPYEEDLKRHLVDKRNSVGNNLMMTGRGWSSSFESEPGDTVDAFSPPRSSMSLPVTRQKTESFGSLLQNYTPASSLSARSVDDVLSNFPSRKDTVYSPEHPDSSVNEDRDNLEDFEVVASSSTHPDPNDVSRMVQFSNIANEKGLDAQNFQCKGCSRAVGLIFGKPRVCKFDGGYYCYECHENDEYYIPASIVHNWDFRKHKVAKKNLEFLMDKEEQPYLSVEEINPRLYDHVQEMQEIKGLRLQLTLLKTYLFTCKQSVAEDLRRLVWPRDYLYENTEQYSLADLLQVPTGALASSLRKVIKFATKHVYGCRLCSQKGFICELCNNPKVIYAFELEATYRCPQCKTVFHRNCKTDNRPCPKCQRRLSRQSYHGSSAIILTPDYDLQSSFE